MKISKQEVNRRLEKWYEKYYVSEKFDDKRGERIKEMGRSDYICECDVTVASVKDESEALDILIESIGNDFYWTVYHWNKNRWEEGELVRVSKKKAAIKWTAL